MVLGPKVLDLPNQLLLRMLDMDLVDAFRSFYTGRTSLAGLLTIALQTVSIEASLGLWPWSGLKPVNTSKSGHAKTNTNLCSSLLAVEASISCYRFRNPSTF